MRQNPHVWICGGPGSATTLVYPTQVPGGGFVLPLFFVALSCAALSSLIAMIELATRVLMDGGMARAVAVRLVAVAAVVCGIPSAVSLAVFENQDWVWGLGLMISGLFVAVAVI